MKQEKVTRKELLSMRVGSTRCFQLTDISKIGTPSVTTTQLKNLGCGQWTVRKDRKSVSVSITRIK